MVIYDSAAIFVESCKTLADKIAAIEAIQDALLSQALKAASKGPISQYSLNDGQTIINATYRNAKEINDSYMAFETLKQMLINRLNGRSFRLVDKQNFIGNGCI